MLSFAVAVSVRRRSEAHCQATLISLGHQLGLKIVAEGVETAEQLDFLRAQGCDAAQGFLICKPLSAEEITRYLTAQALQT